MNFNMILGSGDLSNVIGQKRFSYQWCDCKGFKGAPLSAPCMKDRLCLDLILYLVPGFHHIGTGLHLFYFRQRNSRQGTVRHAAVIDTPFKKIIEKKITFRLKESIHPTSLRITQLFRCHAYDLLFGIMCYKPLLEAEHWTREINDHSHTPNQETVNRVKHIPI